MLSDRDKGGPAIAVGSVVPGTAFAAFYAAISQSFKVSSAHERNELTNSSSRPQSLSEDRPFVLSFVLPGGAGQPFCHGAIGWRRMEKDQGYRQCPPVSSVRSAMFINPGPLGFEEYAVAAVTASSASNGTASIQVSTIQNLRYPENSFSTLLVILAPAR